MNTFGNLGGTLSPDRVRRSLERFGSWNVPLYGVAALYAFSALCWLGIDPESPIELSLRALRVNTRRNVSLSRLPPESTMATRLPASSAQALESRRAERRPHPRRGCACGATGCGSRGDRGLRDVHEVVARHATSASSVIVCGTRRGEAVGERVGARRRRPCALAPRDADRRRALACTPTSSRRGERASRTIAAPQMPRAATDRHEASRRGRARPRRSPAPAWPTPAISSGSFAEWT